MNLRSKDDFIEELKQINDVIIKKDEYMDKHTTLRIGGKADYFLMPQNLESTAAVIKKLNKADLPYYIIGSGSNLLVSDRGVRGAIISLLELSRVEIKEEILEAQAGVALSDLAEIAGWQGLTGLEFASGIPGTLGGAVYMNAGAYGGEMKDVIEEAKVFDCKEEKMKVLSTNNLNLSYRSSRLQNEKMVALSVKMKLRRDNPEDIFERIADLECKRWFKQPLSYPSAGSTFKRPENDYAGRLIEEAGLKGKKVGDAQVSPKHAGFIVNLGNARAEDVLKLMHIIQTEVNEQFGITLRPEPRPIGDFDPEQLRPLFPDGTAV